MIRQAYLAVRCLAANIIFIEKRKSYPASLGNAYTFPDLSVGLYNAFLMKKDVLLPIYEL